MNRGRPSLGPKIVQHLDGPAETRGRLETLLQTLAGQCSVQDACERLGISQARFHELRNSMLQAALANLEPRPAGRPAAVPDQTTQRIAELERQVQDLRIHLHAAQLREEIALAMPHLLRPRDSTLKKTPPRTRPAKRRRRHEPLTLPPLSSDRRCDT